MYFSAPRSDLERLTGQPIEHDRFYVIDCVGGAGIVSGPFATRREAELDRREISIGEDCDVVRAA